MQNNSYLKLSGMFAASFVIMYTAMFLNVNDVEDIYLSTTRLYMTILMITPMAIMMLLFMPKMYPNRRVNTTIYITSALVFSLTFIFLRNQTFVSDKQYMKAMIPHHSSAIMTSSRADLKDPETRALADSIIKSQREEILLMKSALERL
jgi:cytochrome bd-type quinol oxidase subunit 2